MGLRRVEFEITPCNEFHSHSPRSIVLAVKLQSATRLAEIIRIYMLITLHSWKTSNYSGACFLTVTLIMKTYNKSMFLWYVFMYPFAIIYVCDGMCTLHKFPYTACTMSIKCSHLDSFFRKA